MTQVNNFLKKYNGLNFTDLRVAFDDLRSDLYSNKKVNLEELKIVKNLMGKWKTFERLVQEANIMIATNKDIGLIMMGIRDIFSLAKELETSIFLSFTPDDSID